MSKKILVDVIHPANVLFFKDIIIEEKERGHDVRVFSREKDCTTQLLKEFGIEHEILSHKRKGYLGLAFEFFLRTFRLYREIVRFDPDLIIGKESACLSWAARIHGQKAIIFDDTDDAVLQRLLTKITRPFFVDLKKVEIFSPSVYLKPQAQRMRKKQGVIRLVDHTASHDVGIGGLSDQGLSFLIDSLQDKVRISSERLLPKEYGPWLYEGKKSDFLDLLELGRFVITDSPTVALEAALLGVPKIFYVSKRRPWYINYLDKNCSGFHHTYNLRFIVDQIHSLEPSVASSLEIDFEASKQFVRAVFSGGDYA